jgi:proteasome lid subunit RPN8/RPN11
MSWTTRHGPLPANVRRLASVARHLLKDPPAAPRPTTAKPERRAGPFEAGATMAGDSLLIARSAYTRMLDHCLDEYPREGCGLLVGQVNTAVQQWPIANVELSTQFYRFDEQEQLRAWERLDRMGWDPLVIYHSHTVEPMANRRGWELSKTDIDMALDPKITHMVVDLHDPTAINIGLWRVRDRVAVAVPWQVVD